MPLVQELETLSQLRAKNPQLANFNDRDFMDIVELRYPGTFRELPQAGGLAKFAGNVERFAGGVGEAVGKFLGDQPDKPVEGPADFLQRTGARATSMAVSSSPELALQMLGANLLGKGSVGTALGAGAIGLSGLLSYGRSRAQGASQLASVGSGVSSVANLPLVHGATGVASRMIPSKLGANLVGGFAGGTAADAIEIASSDDPMAFLSDPVNIAALGVSNVPDAVLEVTRARSEAARERVEERKRKTPDFESLLTQTKAQELARLRAKPIGARTEMEEERIRQYTDDIHNFEVSRARDAEDRAKRATEGPLTMDAIPESTITLASQMRMMQRGKKKAVFVPRGSNFEPAPHLNAPHFKSFKTEKGTYYYDSGKVNEEQLKIAESSNTLNDLLGYGVPDAPLTPGTKILVLRNAKGHEKAAIPVLPVTEAQARARLQELAEEGDFIRDETIGQVMRWRAQRENSIRHYSLRDESLDSPGAGFTASVFDQLARSITPKIQGYGAKFQLDKDGNVGSAGLRQALRKWVPPDIMAHYEQAGLNEFTKGEKTNFTQFAQWVKDNTPEIEVKKLVPGNAVNEVDQLRHALENTGWRLINEQGWVEGDDGVPVSPQAMQERAKIDPTLQELANLQTLYADAYARMSNNRNSDAATGRYGVEPKRVEEMDRPVDILVRVPTVTEADKAAGRVNNQDKILFRGHHYGNSDVNVLASIRGYFEGDTFVVFEVQSDWGQARSKSGQQDVNEAGEGYGFFPEIKDHPLLRSYETLALKTAIRHALENGASKIAIVDPETALMTEGHDRVGIPGDAEFAPENYRGKVEQEGGMRQHYSSVPFYKLVENKKSGKLQEPAVFEGTFATPELARKAAENRFLAEGDYNIQKLEGSLHKEIRKLTGDRGKPTDLGKFTARGPSNYFGGKDSITGSVYDLSKVDRQAIRRLFSLYDLSAQSNFEARAAKADAAMVEAIKQGKTLTFPEFLSRSLAGENVDTWAVQKFAAAISQNPALVRTFNLQPVEGIRLFGAQNKDFLAINVSNDLTRNVATAFHELSHSTLSEVAQNNPTAYLSVKNYSQVLGVEGRKALLQDLAKLVGVDTSTRIDLDYQAGAYFDQKASDFDDRATHEFVAGIVELLTYDAFSAKPHSRAVQQILSFLPNGIRNFLSSWIRKITSLFSSDGPGPAHLMNEQSKTDLQRALNSLSVNVFRHEEFQKRAANVLRRAGALDESRFVENLSRFDTPEYNEELLSGLKNSSGELRNYSLEVLKESGLGLKKAVKDFYERNFLSGLFRTRIKPFTTNLFLSLHRYRNEIRSKEQSYLAYLGQNDDNSLSLEQALTKWDQLEKRLTGPGGKAALDGISRVLERNQQIREEFKQKNPGQRVPKEALMTEAQMQNEFKLSPEDAKVVTRLNEVMRMVGRQSVLDQELADNYNAAKLFYIQNKTQDIEEVTTKVAQLNRRAFDAGFLRFVREMVENDLKSVNRQQQPDPTRVEQLKARVAELKAREDAFRMEMEVEARQLFGEKIPFDPEPGNDIFLNQVLEVITKQAAARANMDYIMRDEGYAPMTRRGRFLLKIHRDIDGVPIPSSTAEFKGFDTKAELEAEVKKRGIPPEYYEVIDKNELAGRAQMYYPTQLQAVRDKAREDFSKLLERMRNEIRESGSEVKPEIFDVLKEIETSYRPLQDEIRDVLSVKGDKFKERRWNVPGFDRNDFIPNIFEYVNYRTVAGQKAQVRAKANLELARPEFDADPALAQRVRMETDYVLNRSKEAVGLRKFLFNFYLGASIRHMIQNGMQIPLVGIPQLQAEGASGFQAYKHFLNAGKLASKYTLNGTTGDERLDILLKEAEKEGTTIPSAIDLFGPQTDEIQAAMDRAAAWSAGERTIGQSIKQKGRTFRTGVENFMKSSAVASEIANRRTSFIMGYLNKVAQGVTDPQQLFRDAALHTDYVNFIGDKSNRPGFLINEGQAPMHAPLLVLTALQTFTLNQLGQLYSFRQRWKAGSKADRQAFMTSLAHLMVFSGALGLVGMETAEQLFEKITDISLKRAIREGLVLGVNQLWSAIGGDDPEDKEAANKWGGHAADLVLNGLPAMLGVDASSSLGLGSPLFKFQAEHESTALDILGPLGGIIEKGGKALNAVTANPWAWNEWSRAIRMVAPQALNYWMRNIDAMDRNAYLNQSGQPVVEGLDTGAVASTLLGFTPTQVTNRQEQNSLAFKASQRSDEEYRSSVQVIAQALAKFEREGDPNQLLIAQKEFYRYVDSQGGAQNRASLVDSINRELMQFREPLAETPNLKSQAALDQIRSTFPGQTARTAGRMETGLGELAVAQLLGQSDVTFSKMGSLQSSLRARLQYDQLVASGVPESVAALLVNRGKQSSRRLSELSSSSW